MCICLNVSLHIWASANHTSACPTLMYVDFQKEFYKDRYNHSNRIWAKGQKNCFFSKNGASVPFVNVKPLCIMVEALKGPRIIRTITFGILVLLLVKQHCKYRSMFDRTSGHSTSYHHSYFDIKLVWEAVRCTNIQLAPASVSCSSLFDDYNNNAIHKKFCS